VKRFLKKKLIIYLVTIVFAVTLNWLIPRLMPGDPISILLSRLGGPGTDQAQIESFFRRSFQLDRPWYEQYLNYWKSLLTGDLGVSIYLYPKPVAAVIGDAIPYDLLLMFPAILGSWFIGNRVGALAAHSRKTDSRVMPLLYALSAAPYFWLAVLLAWFFGILLGITPVQGASSIFILPSLTPAYILDFLHHWLLPFLSLFIVMAGQWAVGMRNLVLYERGSDYSRYLKSLGASSKLIRRYTYRNALLPQVSGLSIRLGQFLAGVVATEIVFSYPGLGYLLYRAILNQDYFLIQGCFLFIVLFMVTANLVVDLIYMLLDPRVRMSLTGEEA